MAAGKDDQHMKIAIIGGGPAGAFSGHFLEKLAREKNKNITIHIYDYRCFSCQGKISCNMGAGIISATLVEKLEQEGIFLPGSVVKNIISGYQLHSRYNTVYFRKDREKRIYSVFRGQGPLQLDGNINSFDQFMLETVSRSENVSVINKKVTGIDFSNPQAATVTCQDESCDTYDFVIGAFGVNTHLKKYLGNDYRPPKTVRFLQFEMTFPEEFIQKTYKDRVHMFPVYRNNIWFITLTPKWNYVTVTAVGKSVKSKHLKSELLNNPQIRQYLPGKELNIKCACAPELPVGFAKKPYAHRFLVVGDACVSRYMKNGIESAFWTAYLAADTIINHGVTETVLKKFYYRRCLKEYRVDNFCGRMLYWLDRLLYTHPLYTEAHLILAKKEQVTNKTERFSDVLWNMFTGDERYKKVLRDALNPRLLLSVSRQIVLLLAARIVKGKSAFHYPASKFYKLLNRGSVAIVGGGPGGSACAIKLAQLAKQENIQLDIYLFEGKDFQRHRNQCVGILSPPLTKVLSRELGLRLPRSLIRSEVPGYELHTENEGIFLENYHPSIPGGKTYSVRRSEFDQWLLRRAEEHGVHLVNSRVTGIEFCRDAYHDEVRIFSESNFIKADVVVGAFGLDSEMLEKLEEATGGRYRRPKHIMKTFVTRFDFHRRLLDETYDKRIYPFLIASLKHVRFGAVTVKDDHVVVNVAGEKITSLNLTQFLALTKVNQILPEGIRESIDYYSGKFPSSPARKPYGDRYVTVGDATGWLRPLKGKGINLAVITGIDAAKVMINEGCSRKDFEKYKARCNDFRQDYKYGMLVSMSLSFMIKTGILDYMIRKARKKSWLRHILYDAVSAERSYKQIIKSFLFRRTASADQGLFLKKPPLDPTKTFPGGGVS